MLMKVIFISMMLISPNWKEKKKKKETIERNIERKKKDKHKEQKYIKQAMKEQNKQRTKKRKKTKKERKKKAIRKEARANRKRLPKRDPINSEIYNLLMKESEGPSYIATRTRIALCLLTVTGIRIGELLPLKVGQLETLLKEGSCKSQSLFNFGRKKNSKSSKKRF